MSSAKSFHSGPCEEIKLTPEEYAARLKAEEERGAGTLPPVQQMPRPTTGSPRKRPDVIQREEREARGELPKPEYPGVSPDDDVDRRRMPQPTRSHDA